MNDKLLSQLQREMNLLQQANHPHEFNKHLYAIETLARLGQTDDTVTTFEPATASIPTLTSKSTGPHAGITTEELKMMGAKVVSDDVKIKTDDGFGNGDSIFDF